jgi:ABC-type polysaccharide/polyol phosphate export permease
MRSSTSLVEHANLVTKTVFPSEIVPISIFCSSLINHLFTLALVVGAVAWMAHAVNPHLLMLPVYLLLAGLFAVGVGWVVAALQVYLRDTAQATQVVMTLWFWLTPIFIYEEQYPARLRFLLDYNPMAMLVRAYRDQLVTSRAPDIYELGNLVLFSAAAFVAGGLFFRQLKRGFADVL